MTRWLDAIETTSAPARLTSELEQDAEREATADTAGLDLRRVAMHESAHAVVAFQHALDVGRVCIREDASGSAAYSADEKRPDTLLSMSVASLAGVACELILGADPEDRFRLAHSADLLSARLSIDELQAVVPDWAMSTRMIATLTYSAVLSNFGEIRRVAGALLLERELDGAAIRALCGRPQ
jgi:hypothetical protein